LGGHWVVVGVKGCVKKGLKEILEKARANKTKERWSR